MTSSNLEDLFFEAAEKENEELIPKLYAEIKNRTEINSDDISSGLDFIFEAWEDSIESSQVKAKFCMDIALLNPADSPIFRISLHRAFTCLKTSLFMKSAIVKATGIRNEQLSLRTVAERFIILEKLKPGISIFNPETNRLGNIEMIDEITSEVTVRWNTAKSSTVMELERALEGMIFLENVPELPISGKKISGNSNTFNEKINKDLVSVADETVKKHIAFTLAIEAEVNPEDFELWWTGNKAQKKDTTIARHPSTARTLHELNATLLNYKDGKFTEEQQVALNQSLGSMKFRQEPSEMLMLAESLAMISDLISEEKLVNIAKQIKNKVAFWPQQHNNANEKLYAWEKISTKHLPALAQLTADIFSEEYLASLMLLLSFRCWNSIVPVIDKNVLAHSIENASFLSADALLWIWKNRNKLSEKTVDVLSPSAIGKSLDVPGLTTVHELKQLFISDKTFQKELLQRIKGDEMSLLRGVQACESLRMDEKQTLLVKFSALSSTVKKYIEKGEGKKMFAAAGRKHIQQKSAETFDITSIKSFKEMTEHLNDIINKQIPDNSAAIAYARSYGDLRENAEYKAAKERQAFLNKRRAELDQGIQNTKPVDFSLEKPEKTAIPGSTVILKYNDDGSEETFFLLGIWDSDPDKNCIAYRSALGKVINGKDLNDTLQLPDGREAVLSKIEPIPKRMLEELNSE